MRVERIGRREAVEAANAASEGFRFYSVAAIVQIGPNILQLQVGSCRARSQEEAVGAMTREAERKCPNCAVVKVGADAIDFDYLTTSQGAP